MTDHGWTNDQIAAHAAGWLDPAEADRLDAHARDCPDCAAALAAARAVDRTLNTLFAAARPGPALEDRMLLKLRSAAARDRLRSGWRRKLGWGVAASVGLGLTGAGVSRLAGQGGLPLPGGSALEGWSLFAGAHPTEKGDGLPGRSLALSPADFHSAREALRKSETLLGRDGVSPDDGRRSAGSGDGGEAYGLRPLDERDAKSQFPASELKDSAPPVLFARSSGTAGGANPGFNFGTAAGRGNTDSYWFKPADAAGKDLQTDGKQVGKASTAGGREPSAPNLKLWSEYEGAEGGKFADADRDKPSRLTESLPKLGQTVAGVPVVVTQPDPAPAAQRKVILRSGEIEFEVESFDPAVAAVTKLVAAIPGGYVATVNSEKLPNGKVKGAVAVRVPPDHLDGLVLDLRKELGKAGELKGQRIGSQDVTKQYTDLESRLKAARTMEQRLLQIIKEGKGEIKQLLEAEKELGIWRTKIEEAEGELRYYGNLAALSTLTVTLAEKDLRTAAGLTETEVVQAGVEVEDVDAAYRQALAAVAEVKGRVTKSELKQLAAGQFNAVLQFEVSPDAAGPVRDRLRQLGRVARLQIDRVQQAEGGAAPRDAAKVTRGDTKFQVQLYNLANVEPRETTTLQLAVPDVPAAYQTLRDAVGRAKGRVFAAQLNEQDKRAVTAQLDFEVRRTDEGAVQAALAAAGETVSRTVTRAPEADAVTDAKVRFRATLMSGTQLPPRQTTTLTVEVPDVEAAAAVVRAQVREAAGRPVDAQSAAEPAGRATTRLVFDVPLAAADSLAERVKAAGTVRGQQSAQNPQAPEGKFATARLTVTLTNPDPIVASDDGVWGQVRKGLTYSVAVLLASLTWVVFGLCVVLPWALVGYAGYRLLRRFFRPTPTAPASPT